MGQTTADPVSDHRLAPLASSGVVIGTLVNCRRAGALVQLPPRFLNVTVEARTCVPLSESQAGRAVVLVFEGGCPEAAIVLGVLERSDGSEPHLHEQADRTSALAAVTADVDGQRAVISAKEEIVLRCGAASITLTRAGKILIRGAYVSSHSSGVQRLKGATVEIN